MKIAILISGSPRFNTDLDTLITNLQGYDKADWYVSLWDKNPQPDKIGYEDQILVSENWRNVKKDWAVEKISNNLPDQHELIDLEVYPVETIDYPVITGAQVAKINFTNQWKMHLGWKLVNDIKSKHKINYDLVIRARPDIYLHDILDLQQCKNQLNNNPKIVFVPHGFHGYGYSINDLLAISSEQNINIYTELVNHIVEYNNSGITCHPETLLAYHLVKHNLDIRATFKAELRLCMTKIENHLVANFGRWG